MQRSPSSRLPGRLVHDLGFRRVDPSGE